MFSRYPNNNTNGRSRVRQDSTTRISPEVTGASEPADSFPLSCSLSPSHRTRCPSLLTPPWYRQIDSSVRPKVQQRSRGSSKTGLRYHFIPRSVFNGSPSTSFAVSSILARACLLEHAALCDRRDVARASGYLNVRIRTVLHLIHAHLLSFSLSVVQLLTPRVITSGTPRPLSCLT